MPLKPRYEMFLRFRGPESQLVGCVLHYTGAAPPNPAAMATVVDAVSAAWAVDAKPVIPTECQFLGVSGRYISETESFEHVSVSGAGVGTVTGDTLPAEVSVIMQKRGQGPAKRARGTVYWPCVPAAYVDSSNVNFTGTTAYAPVVSQLTLPITGGGITLSPVVMSRTAATLYPFTQAALTAVVGHQRRRRPG